MKFKEYALEEVLEKIFSGGTPNTQKKEYWNGNIPWLSSGETRNRIIKYTEKFISNEGVNNSSTKQALKGDIVIASAGQGSTRGQTSLLDIDTYINQSIISLRVNDEIVDNKYLYYNIFNRYNELRAISDSASIRGSLTTAILKKIKVQLPSLEIQRKVVSILWGLDSKIELNKEIVKNIEDVISSIFKNWFIDFEFPNEQGLPYRSSGGGMVESELGKIPKGWSASYISELGEIIGGGTPSKKEEEYYTDNGIPWITPKDLSINKSKFIYKGLQDISELGLTKSSAKLMPKGTVLLSSRAPIGYIAIAGTEVTTNQGFKSIIPNKGYSEYFIYFKLKEMLPVIEANAGGSTFKEISGSGLKAIQIVLPRIDIVNKFNEVVEVLFDQIKLLEAQTENLVSLRDSLLPKLLSGEIKIPDESVVKS